MKNAKFLLAAVFGIFTVTAIAYWVAFIADVTTVYEGTYKNDRVVVKQTIHSGFVRNTVSHSVQIGRLRPVKIDYSSTDSRGAPYDKAMFELSKPVFIDNSFSYENELVFDSPTTKTMLYLSAANFTPAEYLAYQDFFKNHWLPIQKTLLDRQNGFFTNILGVVYGDKKTFTKVFTGKLDNQNFSLTVYPDGEIVLQKADGPRSELSHGLSKKVQMPGRVIYVMRNQDPSAPDFDTFKDSSGNVLRDYFELKPAILKD